MQYSFKNTQKMKLIHLKHTKQIKVIINNNKEAITYIKKGKKGKKKVVDRARRISIHIAIFSEKLYSVYMNMVHLP